MTTEPTAAGSEVLFYESGASWLWVLLGPLAAAAMLWIQVSSGYGYQPLVPLAFLIMVTGLLAVQVKAARIHTRVQLTPDLLYQGTESFPVSDIVGLYPPAPATGRGAKEPPKWTTARTLGELTGVPRGRTGIGLRLSHNRNAQAWARNHRGLRAALAAMAPEYTGPFDTSRPDADIDGGPGSWR